MAATSLAGTGNRQPRCHSRWQCWALCTLLPVALAFMGSPKTATGQTRTRVLDSTASHGVIVQLGDNARLIDEETPTAESPQPNSLTVCDGITNQAPDAQSGNEKKESSEEAQKKKQKELARRVANAHKPVFYDNDFSYLCDPDYCGWQLGDAFKRRCLAGAGWYDMGGEYRMRYQGERNFRGLGLTGIDDDFLLNRTRLYGDFHFGPDIRVFAEMIDAESNYENFPLRAIEVNRTDMLNLFVDAVLIRNGDDAITARVGRQELLYGAQRLISPLDWANTRRTFDGIRILGKGKDYSIDGFWTHPVRPDPDTFDAPDRDQEFMGVYSSFTGEPNVVTDLYALRYLNGAGANDFEINTTGLRRQGSRGELLWEVEGAYQFGENTDGSDKAAGMVTMGLGRKFAASPWTPTLWAYYDFASGDSDLGAGNGFNQLFPLAHKYFGFMDLFGRSNIEDINLLLTVSPGKKLTFLAWYHNLFLATASDTPYSVVMTPFNPGNEPGSTHLGQEIDLLATYNVSARQQLLLGYSHFFSGAYYSTTAGVPFAGDADFFYSQWLIAF